MRTPILILLPLAGWAAELEVLTLANWQRLPVGEQAMVEGGAVVARVDGPAAGFINPAGLARLENPSISGSISAIEYTRVGSRGSGGSVQTDQTSLRPNLVGFANALGEGDAGGWSFTLATPVSWASTLTVRTDTIEGTRRDDGRSSFEMLVPALAWGRGVGAGWSVGFACEAWLTEYRFDSGTAAATATSVLTSTYSEDGSSLALRLAAGTQWECGAWRFGASLRSPGVTVSDRGTVSSATTSGDGTTTTLQDVYDDVGFSYPLPLAATLGAAWRPEGLPGFDMEFDLALYAGCGDTDVFGSASGTTTTVTGGSATVAPVALPARHLDQRAVANPRLGLGYRLPDPVLGRTVRLHLGAYMDHSPVASSDVFSRLDLLGGTAGITAARGPMQLTLGGAFVTSSTIGEALGYVTSPGSGLEPSLAQPDATFAVRTFVLAIGSTYRF